MQICFAEGMLQAFSTCASLQFSSSRESCSSYTCTPDRPAPQIRENDLIVLHSGYYYAEPSDLQPEEQGCERDHTKLTPIKWFYLIVFYLHAMLLE